MKANLRRHYFAIRHNPSGGFLPAVKGYGFTRTSPTLDEPPRLFGKTGPARQALDRWLEGELFEGTPDDENRIDLRLVRKPDRMASQMEIVEVELQFRSLSEAELRRL